MRKTIAAHKFSLRENRSYDSRRISFRLAHKFSLRENRSHGSRRISFRLAHKFSLRENRSHGSRRISFRLVLMVLSLILVPLTAFADNTVPVVKGFPVLVSVESYDKTLLRKETIAFTFKEALQKLAEENGLELTLTQSGSRSEIYSVNNIQNSYFKGNDGWYGCIYRGNSLLAPDDFLNLTLDTGDILTLYYGEPDKTKMLSDFQMEVRNDMATFTALAERTEWSPQNDGWVRDTVTQQIQDVKIHLFIPGGTQKILNTGENGQVSTTLANLGIYKYYAEGYVFNHVPHIVRTADYHFLYGVENKNRITRGEAAAFIVNTYNPTQNVRENNLEDIGDETAHYEEIDRAVTAGLVSGYEDGTFRPSEPVSLLQLCLMLSGLYPVSVDPVPVPGVPVWAQEPVNRLLAVGALQGIPLNWDDTVGEEQLTQIYLNTNSQPMSST